ncbi:MAG: AAA family ATPase [Promethearchaeota archaeon]
MSCQKLFFQSFFIFFVKKTNNSDSKEIKKIKELNKKLGLALEDSERYRNEADMFKRELDKLRLGIQKKSGPPLLLATVSRILDNNDNLCIIHTPSGNDFLVSTPYHTKVQSGDTVGVDQRTLKIVRVLPSVVDTFISSMELVYRPKESYQDIGGLEGIIQKVREVVELPLISPEKFKKIGIEPPNGILLVGPPGTGKTLLARAVANATDATFIRLVGSELVQKYIGEGARLVRELFSLAREKAPVILFIDEIDAVAASRTNDDQISNREVQRTLMQLLAEMDGFNPLDKVRIIGATNRPDILDSAILRAGRFDRIITFEYPNEKGRFEIFKIHTRNMPLVNFNIKSFIRNWDNKLSGADIKAICTEAGMVAIREDHDKVQKEDFSFAYAEFIRENRGKKPTAPVYS